MHGFGPEHQSPDKANSSELSFVVRLSVAKRCKPDRASKAPFRGGVARKSNCAGAREGSEGTQFGSLQESGALGLNRGLSMRFFARFHPAGLGFGFGRCLAGCRAHLGLRVDLVLGIGFGLEFGFFSGFRFCPRSGSGFRRFALAALGLGLGRGGPKSAKTQNEGKAQGAPSWASSRRRGRRCGHILAFGGDGLAWPGARGHGHSGKSRPISSVLAPPALGVIVGRDAGEKARAETCPKTGSGRLVPCQMFV